MAYFLYIVNRDKYKEFSRTDKTICDFKARFWKAVKNIKVGDKLICYISRFSHWAGVLEVISAADQSGVSIRMRTKPISWLNEDNTISIFSDEIWNRLSFTHSQARDSKEWKSVLINCRQLSDEDGAILEKVILEHADQHK